GHPIPNERVSFYEPGQESEAVRAADFLLLAWQRHPGALTWLRTGQPPVTPSREGQPASGGPAIPAGQLQGPLDNFFLGPVARRWLDALLAGTDTMPIVRALDPATLLPGELMLKASVCCEMLVAAELVAAGLGRPSRHLPRGAALWLLERDVLFSPG